MRSMLQLVLFTLLVACSSQTPQPSQDDETSGTDEVTFYEGTGTVMELLEDHVWWSYSMDSTIGLSTMLTVGPQHFRAMNEHFRTAPFERNLPVLIVAARRAGIITC